MSIGRSWVRVRVAEWGLGLLQVKVPVPCPQGFLDEVKQVRFMLVHLHTCRCVLYSERGR
jgi:hypothetical protein